MTHNKMILFDASQHQQYVKFRIPGIITSGDTVIAYCEARKQDSDWAQIDITARISNDGGKSFGPLIKLNAPANEKTVNNPVMIPSDDGTIHFIYCIEYGINELGGGVFYRKSCDLGKTWSKTLDITKCTLPEIRNAFATGPGHGIELTDKTLLIPCWFVKKGSADIHSHHPANVCFIYSKDKGASWNITPELHCDDEVTDPNETAVAESANGSIYISVRDGNTRSRCYSSGNTANGFSPIRPDKNLNDPICCAGLTSDGETLYMSNCDSTTARKNLTVKYSTDIGRTWNKLTVIDSENAGYSDIAVAKNKQLFVLYEKSNDILFTTVSAIH